MKVKTIKVEYTTGKTTEISGGKGFLVLDGKVMPLADWDMNDAFKAVGSLALSTMAAQVENYKTFKPLFDKLEETTSNVKRQLSKEQWSKDFAYRYQQGFLIDEVTHNPDYKELFDKMVEYSEAATKKLNESSTKESMN